MSQNDWRCRRYFTRLPSISLNPVHLSDQNVDNKNNGGNYLYSFIQSSQYSQRLWNSYWFRTLLLSFLINLQKSVNPWIWNIAKMKSRRNVSTLELKNFSRDYHGLDCPFVSDSLKRLCCWYSTVAIHVAGSSIFQAPCAPQTSPPAGSTARDLE